MDLSYTDFQMLSSCEAIAMKATIDKVIEESFKGGLRTAFIMEHCNLHPEENIKNIQYYLTEVGVYLDEKKAVEILAQALIDVVRRESKKEDKFNPTKELKG